MVVTASDLVAREAELGRAKGEAFTAHSRELLASDGGLEPPGGA